MRRAGARASRTSGGGWLKLVSDPGSVRQPVNDAAAVIAGLAGCGKVIEVIAAAVSAAAQVFECGGVMPAMVVRRIAKPQPLPAVAAAAALPGEEEQHHDAFF